MFHRSLNSRTGLGHALAGSMSGAGALRKAKNLASQAASKPVAEVPVPEPASESTKPKA